MTPDRAQPTESIAEFRARVRSFYAGLTGVLDGVEFSFVSRRINAL